MVHFVIISILHYEISVLIKPSIRQYAIYVHHQYIIPPPPDRTITFYPIPLLKMTPCVSQYNWLWPWTACLSVMDGWNTSDNKLGTV